MEGPVNPINNDNVIPNQFDTAEEIEGYDYCTTKKQKCLNDCAGSPMLSTLD